jgi:DMSO reductase anchor subunit
MTAPMANKGASFHELPLVLFTALATAGGGLGSAHLAVALLGWSEWTPTYFVRVLLVALMAIGLLFSVGHLGRPFRGPLALLRLGRSHLSNEVLVVGGTMVVGLTAAVLPDDHTLLLPFAVSTLVGSFLTLLALGQVYRLKGQLTWRGPVFLHPLILGLGFGLTVGLEFLQDGAVARGELLVLVILAMDALLIWERSRRISASLLRGMPTRPRFMAQRGVTLSFRILFGVLLPAVALIQGFGEVAIASLSVNLFLDRFLFYGLAVRDSTESEILRVDGVLAVHGEKGG